MSDYSSQVAKDPRFRQILTDPRFKRIPKHEKKLQIDTRFKSMFTDEKFQMKYSVDKRGRKIRQSSSENLSKYYKLSEEDCKEEITATRKKKKIKNPQDNGSLVQEKGGKRETKSKVKLASSDKDRQNVEGGKVGCNDGSSSYQRDADGVMIEDEEEGEEEEGEEEEGEEEEVGATYSEESISSSESDQELLPERKEENQYDVVHAWGQLDTDCPTGETTSSRLAVCNIDWDRLGANDIFILLNSFKPKDGVIKSVKVYPSEYGKEKMAYEDMYGPDLPKKGKSGSGDDVDSVEILRQYQLQRLKYYYAVVECDTITTAEHIYNECDGLEYELSATRLDLRFIPDDVTFDNAVVTSEAGEVSSTHHPTPAFITTALQQSSVRLTWDETDPRRTAATMKKYNEEEVLNADLGDFLASSTSESECDGDEEGKGTSSQQKLTEEERLEKYKKLLSNLEDSHSKSDDIDMELTWEPGLLTVGDTLNKNREQKQREQKQSAWEKYLEKKKEKTKEKKKSKKTKPEQNQSADNSADLAELELVMMDDESEKHHFSLKEIIEKEKLAKKKKKGKSKIEQEDDFQIDPADPRFVAVYESADYSLDPSHPLFRRTKAMDTIFMERQKRLKKKEEHSKPLAEAKRSKARESTSQNDYQQLVKSIKAKTLNNNLKKRTKKLKK